MITLWRRVKKIIIHSNPWWNYCSDTFERPDGSTGIYYYGEAVNLGHVIIIPLLSPDHLMLIENYRYLKENNGIEFPAGWIFEHETPEVAARRELAEELGINTNKLTLIGTFETAPGVFKNTGYVFVASELTESKRQPAGRDPEIQRSLTIPIQKIPELIREHQIWNSLTLAAWSLFQSTKQTPPAP